MPVVMPYFFFLDEKKKHIFELVPRANSMSGQTISGTKKKIVFQIRKYKRMNRIYILLY